MGIPLRLLAQVFSEFNLYFNARSSYFAIEGKNSLCHNIPTIVDGGFVIENTFLQYLGL